MQGSELLTKILTDFFETEDGLQIIDRQQLEKFCTYANKWLIDRGCLGLGHAANGLNLRFADGTELLLFSAHGPAEQPAADVSISGNNTKLAVNAAPMANNSVQITGR